MRVLEPITPRVNDLGNWEMNETLARMMERGFNKVRGSEWTRCQDLSRDELVSVKTLCCGMGDLCRMCGLPGHMSTQCNTIGGKAASWMLELNSLIETKAKTNAKPDPTPSVGDTLRAIVRDSGDKVPKKRKSRSKYEKTSRVKMVWCCEYCGKEFSTEKGAKRHEDMYCKAKESESYSDGDVCFRCGRTGHWASACYAKKDVHGGPIWDH